MWPRQALPELEGAFKALGSLMVQVGAHLARHMDALVQRETGVEGGGGLESVVRLSPAHKARLLHYFPSVSRPRVSVAQADEGPAGVTDEGAGEENTAGRPKADTVRDPPCQLSTGRGSIATVPPRHPSNRENSDAC